MWRDCPILLCRCGKRIALSEICFRLASSSCHISVTLIFKFKKNEILAFGGPVLLPGAAVSAPSELPATAGDKAFIFSKGEQVQKCEGDP